MKTRWFLVFLATAALGSAMHFLYDWAPVPLAALFAPINESVWEHLKLLFWPFLLASAVLSRGQGQRFWGAALAAQLAMPLALLGAYYLLSGGFAVESLAVDIGLYFAALALGFVFTWRFRNASWAGRALGVLILVVAFYAASLILFSIAAPALPIFISKV